MNVLSAIDSWPVGQAAAAVVGESGIVAAHGPTADQFPLASVTKPLAVLAALVAVEEGAISLNDPVAPETVPGATVRHLMSHASGLAPERMMRSFPPAKRRVYSNVGIEVLGDHVSKTVEMPFTAYAAEALAPLDLRRTKISGSPARDWISTVDDLAAVVRALLTPSGLLHPSTLAEATSVNFPGLRGVLPGFGAQDPNDWGLGFEIRGQKKPHWTGSANSPNTYGHFGQSGTFFWVDPDARVGLIALTDRDFDSWATEAWPALADAVLASVP